jgi:uncharacterized protein
MASSNKDIVNKYFEAYSKKDLKGIRQVMSETVTWYFLGQIVAENSNRLIECIHSKTNRPDNNNLEHYACVLWAFENGKIIEGRHFFLINRQ